MTCAAPFQSPALFQRDLYEVAADVIEDSYGDGPGPGGLDPERHTQLRHSLVFFVNVVDGKCG